MSGARIIGGSTCSGEEGRTIGCEAKQWSSSAVLLENSLPGNQTREKYQPHGRDLWM
jgi:hypothetical protein